MTGQGWERIELKDLGVTRLKDTKSKRILRVRCSDDKRQRRELKTVERDANERGQEFDNTEYVEWVW